MIRLPIHPRKKASKKRTRFLFSILINSSVDIDKNKNWVLSHLAFPDIKFCYKVLEKNGKSLSQNLIMECPKVFATSERNLFRTIISKSSKKGADFKEISQIANKILTCNSRKKFLNERIKFLTFSIPNFTKKGGYYQ